MTTRLPYDLPAGSLTGTAGFRLLATHDPTTGPATLDAADAARGRAARLDYTWTHPDDGEQAGTLLLGVPGEDGTVSAGWVDSWHQPDPTRLDGTGHAGGATVGYEYAPGWRWEVELEVTGAGVVLEMRNVVPEHDDGPATTYDVMRATWS